MLALVFALAAAQQPDSQRVLRFARDAQHRFESIRRGNLPIAPGRPGGTCDERIGRFCLWHDDAGANRPPSPAEAPRIREARDRLVHQLDSAAALLPGDEWIAGQRVRYLVESGRGVEALAAARACAGTQWWCAALTGLALHRAGNFGAGDSAYQSALRDMPHDERCRWTDIGVVLEGKFASRYRRLGCDERTALEDRVWWLAQPLYSLPSNDRRTEHFARVTMSRIAEHSRNPYGVPWGDDLREITLRYGWPAYWTRDTPGLSSSFDVAVTSHDPPNAVHVVPSAEALEDPGTARADDWAPDARRPRETYAPPYASALARLEHQVAWLRRGDSCLVVAAYDVRGDTLFAGTTPDAALVLAPDGPVAPVVERRPAAGTSGVLAATAECGPLLLSLEVVAPGRRHAARARYGVRPTDAGNGGVAVSDILLFDPPDSLPTDLAAVLPYVRPAATARPGARLGLFWEIYGLSPAGEVVTASVNVVPARTGWLRRRTESIGLTRRRTPLRLEWTEMPRVRGLVAGRALALDLSGISPGRYRVEVRVETGRGAAGAARELRVLER